MKRNAEMVNLLRRIAVAVETLCELQQQANQAAAIKPRKTLTLNELPQLLALGKSTVRRMISNKQFPAPHYVSPRKLIWYRDEIEKWQRSLPRSSKRKKSRKA